MTVKRRNHGRARKNAGSKGKLVVCDGCGGRVAKDKAVKRFQVRNICDQSSMRDLKEASAYENYLLPKMYYKMAYCIDCAVHRRIVRGRAEKDRKNRKPPERRRRPVEKKKTEAAK
jgi:small subunit ribosomal protein S26e